MKWLLFIPAALLCGLYFELAYVSSHLSSEPAARGTPCSEPTGYSYETFEQCEAARILIGLKGHCAKIP